MNSIDIRAFADELTKIASNPERDKYIQQIDPVLQKANLKDVPLHAVAAPEIGQAVGAGGGAVGGALLGNMAGEALGIGGFPGAIGGGLAGGALGSYLGKGLGQKYYESKDRSTLAGNEAAVSKALGPSEYKKYLRHAQ